MGKVIKIPLSAEGFSKAAEEVEKYANSLKQKNEELIKELADIGIQTINATMAGAPADYNEPYSVEPIFKSDGGMSGVVINLSGADVLFLEFSAGITFGQSDYPLPSGAGFGMLTYPDQTHADQWYGWWYPDEGSPTGYSHTYGTPALMPMYHADQAIIEECRRIASEIFG